VVRWIPDQVGNDSGCMLRYEQVLANYKLPDCHPCVEVNTIFGQPHKVLYEVNVLRKSGQVREKKHESTISAFSQDFDIR
jgi:hypothetical protein